MSQAQALYKLQTIDVHILRNQKRLAEIAQALEDNQVVVAAQTQLEKSQNTLKPLQQKVRDVEHEIESTTNKARATEDRLYSGTVKNPKELQDMQNEIASLKKWQSELEDRQLAAMVAVEEAESVVDDAQTQLDSVVSLWEAEHSELLTEKKQLEAEIAEQQSKREGALKDVSADSLKLYNRLRKSKGNQPVALLKGQNCGICGIGITTTIEQQVRRAEELVYCPNCERILCP